MVTFGMGGIEGTFLGDRNVPYLVSSGGYEDEYKDEYEDELSSYEYEDELSKRMGQNLFHPCILLYVSMLKN